MAVNGKHATMVVEFIVRNGQCWEFFRDQLQSCYPRPCVGEGTPAVCKSSRRPKKPLAARRRIPQGFKVLTLLFCPGSPPNATLFWRGGAYAKDD